MIKQIDALALFITDKILRFRWWVVAATLAMVVLAAAGGRFIEFSNNYRVFFGKDNPELIAFEDFQANYTKNDNILIVVKPKDGKIFTQDTATAVEDITKQAWNIPYAIRVDSVSNFQYSWANGDDLTVEDLLRNSAGLSQETLDKKEQIALAEPLLKGNLISDNASTTGINVTLQYPEKSITEVPEAVGMARMIVTDIKSRYPDLKIALTGVAMMNNTFAESAIKDLSTLIPVMYLMLILVMIFALRSISGTVVTLFIVGFSSLTAMGIAGYAGIDLTPISATAPTIILTLAIADSIHILVILRKLLLQGMDKITAIKESIRINAIPVTVTSLTTIIGFLGLNFSDTPPFHDLGNITAIGIAAAWFYSMTFLPAAVSILPFKVNQDNIGKKSRIHYVISRYADFVALNYKPIGVVMGTLAIFASFMVTKIELNDEWVKYFDHRIEFRNDAEFAMEHLTGIYQIEYSIPGGGEGSINNIEYLTHLDKFTDWLKNQKEVRHVFSYSDIIKRLNKNMHGDDPAWYRMPDSRNLAAQYLLLYELSLPFGLDLNDRISVDKSASRVTVSLPEISTKKVRQFIDRSKTWLAVNAPAYMANEPTGSTVMFSHISERNIKSMIKGNAVALALIAIVLIVSLGSFRLGMLSLIPNTLPILITFGIWAMLVGTVGMAAATVTSTSLGIVVDDTVHFLAKYLRARKEMGMDPPGAIKYAFETVGQAIIATTLILGIGFAILATSTFLINSQMGLLTAMTIIVAFIFDFTLLPVILLMGTTRKGGVYEPAKAY